MKYTLFQSILQHLPNLRQDLGRVRLLIEPVISLQRPSWKNDEAQVITHSLLQRDTYRYFITFVKNISQLNCAVALQYFFTNKFDYNDIYIRNFANANFCKFPRGGQKFDRVMTFSPHKGVDLAIICVTKKGVFN